ncbi:MAG: hypothetical protein GW775_04330, partial [Candidatus Magasanikbacteria bacterium]|nr:hypothetical protein [Candidatus Magasanikbacteria bacterium]
KQVDKTNTKIMMNVGDPDHAFSLSFLPNDGVGLAREEFIFSNFIRIHPLALLNYDKLKDKKAKKQIAEITRGYKKKSDYAVDKLAEGIARISASFYPKDVIVRLSDFKTNEYATLIGGKEFEPKEENPMLGWRGASRYYSKEYKPGFKLECEAIKKVREEWGLKNLIVMIPFCRTPEEGQKVLDTMKEFGLERGKEGLQVYVMCEIPSNVILADDFAQLFDGFSIGSNDLTQLTLGVDRDSALVSHVYSEKNQAVVKLIKDVIRSAHKHKRKVGICGQAPSDYPEFAEMLVREGIDSISLNPDTVIPTRERIAFTEKTLGRKGKKTHKTYLGLVTLLGIISAFTMTLGAGCNLSQNVENFSNPVVQEVTPAQIRENAEKKALETQQQEKLQLTQTLNIADFANFSIKYPQDWIVNYWNGGVTITDTSSSEYLSIFKQLVSHPVDASKKIKINLADKEAFKYTQTFLSSTKSFTVVEVNMGDYVLEMNSDAKNFDEILATFQFTDMTNPDRPLTHWDVREKRVCVQMMTYARQAEGTICQAFPTPCDVPEGWNVCDATSL